MLALAMGNGYVALAGAIVSARAEFAAAGPVENILIARYTPSRYHGLGFGAKFVVALGASPLAILLIAWVRRRTGSLDLLFLGLAGTSRRDHRWWRCCCRAASRSTAARRRRRPRRRSSAPTTWSHARRLVGRPRQAAVEPGAGIGERPEVELDRLGPAADRGEVEIGHGEARAQQIVAALQRAVQHAERLGQRLLRLGDGVGLALVGRGHEHVDQDR